uniref:Uroporphyrinogen decarboxylase (URO-D) domain-containing protein n=1 Tax=Chenopodium quinoa TaxID=63459 RepID=A0A803NDI9_CHEQI
MCCLGLVAESKGAITAEPLLLNAVKGLDVERPPVWLMRQAGRYMKADILTPLAGMNIPFDIVKGKGPVIFDPLSTQNDVDVVREFVPEESVPYVGEALTILRKEVGNEAAVLGFVGAPFTLASYVVEGGSSKHFSKIKRLAFSEPKVLHALLQKFATSMAKYVKYQADHGAQAVQIFDSWATELSPVDFEEFSLPYLKQIVDSSNMAEGRRRLGSDIAVQGNVDPGVLFGSKEFITSRIMDTVKKAGNRKHILNLGHGIVV